MILPSLILPPSVSARRLDASCLRRWPSLQLSLAPRRYLNLKCAYRCIDEYLSCRACLAKSPGAHLPTYRTPQEAGFHHCSDSDCAGAPSHHFTNSRLCLHCIPGFPTTTTPSHHLNRHQQFSALIQFWRRARKSIKRQTACCISGTWDCQSHIARQS